MNHIIICIYIMIVFILSLSNCGIFQAFLWIVPVTGWLLGILTGLFRSGFILGLDAHDFGQRSGSGIAITKSEEVRK